MIALQPGSSLTARRREQELGRLAAGDQVDVLVVGGGVTGAGVALDAASRGLSVALVERHDLAFGTSRWSSKLVHGGLRYLARGDIGLAYESARERDVLLCHTAPHLVHPLQFVVPITADWSRLDEAWAGAGLLAGDVLRAVVGTSRRTLPTSRRVSRTAAVRLFPALDPAAVRGALTHWDCRLEDDARLVVALARTAATYGARVLTRLPATAVDGNGASVRDGLSGQTVRLRARHVVVATGVWAGELSPAARIRPSSGTHLVVRADALGTPTAAATISVPDAHGEWVLVVPRFDGTVLVGLTDQPISGPLPDVASPLPGDEQFLLETVSRALRRPLRPADVIGRYAGLRPLLDGRTDRRTADLSRHHALLEDRDTGVLTLVGGKLTTYRRMAQDAVDRICARPGVDAGRCRTARLPLVGAGPVLTAAPDRLIRRYGAEAPAVAALADGQPQLLSPVVDGSPVLGVELLWGLRHEGALCAADLVDRRTRLGLVDAAREAAMTTAHLLVAAAGSAADTVA